MSTGDFNVGGLLGGPPSPAVIDLLRAVGNNLVTNLGQRYVGGGEFRPVHAATLTEARAGELMIDSTDPNWPWARLTVAGEWALENAGPDPQPVELHLTIGLPASGKTTWARGWVDRMRALGRPAARVNRDDVRRMMFDRLVGVPEEQVTAAAHTMVAALLRTGVSVVCDDTNMHSEHRAALVRVGEAAGATVILHPEFLEARFDEIQARDSQRGPTRVGESEMARLFAIHLQTEAASADAH